MTPSKYLSAFKRLKELCADDYTLYGDVLLVEKVVGQELKKEVMGPNGQKTELFLAGGYEKKIDGLDMNLPMLVRVLDVGPGYYDPEELNPKPMLCDAEPGDIVLVGRMSVNWFSVFGSLVSTASGEIGLTRESEVRLRFKGADAYDKCFGVLNRELAPRPDLHLA